MRTAIKHLLAAALLLSLLACDGQRDGAADSAAQLVYTRYPPASELFGEFPALVVDEPSRFLAHFTWLENHQPVDARDC